MLPSASTRCDLREIFVAPGVAKTAVYLPWPTALTSADRQVLPSSPETWSCSVLIRGRVAPGWASTTSGSTLTEVRSTTLRLSTFGRYRTLSSGSVAGSGTSAEEKVQTRSVRVLNVAQ